MNANDNDSDDPAPFIQLAAATRNVTRYLQADKKQNEQGSGETDAGKGDDEKGSENRAYVEHRLREISAFERIASGNGPRRQRK